MADYPAAVTSFPTLVDYVDYVLASHHNTRGDEIVAIETTLGTNPQGNAASLKARLAHSIDDDGYLNFDDATELTIASDAITITQNAHKLQPESSTSDNLATISGTVAGDFGVLYVSDFGTDTITFKHNTGNILCLGGNDIALSYGAVAWYSNGTEVFVIGISSVTLANGSVTLAKMADMATDSFLGRDTASTGVPEVMSVATSITLLLGSALPENVAIILDPALSADGKYSGIVETGIAGATLAFGDLVYLAVADSRWELVDADAEATTFGKIGICVLAAASDGSATTILLYGKVRADAVFPALTIGAPVFAGTTAGDIQTTAPSGAADIIRIIGYGNTADELFFCPSPDYFEHA